MTYDAKFVEACGSEKNISDDNSFMKIAIEEAKKSAAEGEVPVGAVVVCNGEVISTGRNRREESKNALAHAEIEAIDGACRKMGGWRLFMCDLYVTLEPCTMCAGAIINARIKRVVFGAKDPKAGAFGSILDINNLPLNHKTATVGSVMEKECSVLLSEFFAGLRCKFN